MSVMLSQTGVRKAAILLVQLGKDRASRLLGHLHDDEVEAISAEIARLGPLGSEETDAVLEEFRELAAAQASVGQGGESYARDMLEKSLGKERANAIMNRLTASGVQLPFEFLRRTDPRHLLTFISEEHPQVIAVVLAHLPSERATQVLAGLEPEVQADVAHRIAVMDRTAPSVLRQLEESLERKMSSALPAGGFTSVGGVEPLVDIIHRVDRATERLIVEALENRDPALAAEVKSRMFTFEDIVNLENRDLQLVLRQVETVDLAYALKGVSEEVMGKVTSNMSERAAAALADDIELLGPVLLRQVEEAQQHVIQTIRSLEEAGEITLKRGADDEYVV